MKIALREEKKTKAAAVPETADISGGALAVIVPALSLVTALSALLFMGLLLVDKSYDAYSLHMLGWLCGALLLLFLDVYRQHRRWDWRVALIGVLAIGSLLARLALPEYFSALQLNAAIHRSVVSMITLAVSALPGLSVSLYYLLGANPEAEDVSRYPLILTPIVLTLALYLVLMAQLFASGLTDVNWRVLTESYANHALTARTLIAGDWPTWETVRVLRIGILNHIAGTGLLMLLTTLISLPVGAGAGVFLSEYGKNTFGKVARFCVTSLRAISVFVLSLAAFSLAHIADGTPLENLFHGARFDGWAYQPTPGGSYLVASIVLSMLVIPVIARATEEGIRSLPQELREGSLALGASEDHTLLRIILPWSLPNIITGVLLGCIEAAGSVAVLLLIAGRGEFGVGIFKQVTSLAFLILDTYYGDPMFLEYMKGAQHFAGVLLLFITLSLGLITMFSRRWLTRRFRGGV